MFRPFAIIPESTTNMLVSINRFNFNIIYREGLEQLQFEAARIVTGLTCYASLHSLFAESGWENLNTRRKIKKLSLFYNIFKGDTPDYLSDVAQDCLHRQHYNCPKLHKNIQEVA
jgi:hypothetical protein